MWMTVEGAGEALTGCPPLKILSKYFAFWTPKILPVHGRPDLKICCVLDVYARYGPDVRGRKRGWGVFQTDVVGLGGGGGQKRQFLVRRLLWMALKIELKTKISRLIAKNVS